MATAAQSPRKTVIRIPRLGLSSEKGDEILGLVLLATAVLLALSIYSFHPEDPSLLHRPAGTPETQNWIGPVGANVADLTISLCGLLALTLPLPFAFFGWRRFRHQPPIENRNARLLGAAMVVVVTPPLLQLAFATRTWHGSPFEAGGAIGVLLAELLEARLNLGGTLLVLGTILVVGIALVVQSTLDELFDDAKDHLGSLGRRLDLIKARRNDRREKRKVSERVFARQQADAIDAEAIDSVRLDTTAPAARSRTTQPPTRPAPPADHTPPARMRPGVVYRRNAGAASGSHRLPTGHGEPPHAEPPHTESTQAKPTSRRDSASRIDVSTASGPVALPPDAARAAEPTPTRVTRDAVPTRREATTNRAVRRMRPSSEIELPAKTAEQTALMSPEEAVIPRLPPINLLELRDDGHQEDESELVRLGEVIERSCSEFGVEGSIEAIGPGPVITVFEMQPAPGVKVSRVVNLQDDLALALKAESVRIDRIPGRSTLGIEVPNQKRSFIHLGRLLASETFTKAPSVLTVALGVDIHGRPIYADLATMPHLLVAGATGAGKSVGLQTMITSIIYKATREQVQFIFIDPKRIELGVYADIPHLKTEVVVEPKKAANALRWAVAEMERRYRLLADVHVRSIAYYNRAVTDPKERARLALEDRDGDSAFEDLQPLPYYVVVIDELADLMMVAAADVEHSIARLAQMARAVGIHLIIATQRPSVDVITGTIKANFPCRLAYATATRHDSRTILDQVGAEKLLGKGDALFMPPGASRIKRLHGAYISEQETAALIRWLKKQGKPQYDPDVVKAMDDDESGGSAGRGGGGDDAMFEEAARLVVAERQGSASFLQRRLRIGFSRAARLIDMLAADGILGPPQGSKPREVLVPPDFFSEIDNHE